MLFGQLGLLFVFVIQTAMKCQATFCDDLIKKLNEEVESTGVVALTKNLNLHVVRLKNPA